jgi:Ca-activated chloride channel family protein
MKRFPSAPRLLGPLLLLLLCLTLPPIGLASGLIVVDEAIELPRVVPPHPPSGRHLPMPLPPRPIHRHLPLELKRQTVEAKIQDQIATTQVTQVFENTSSHRFEGTFLFPLPANAHIQDFSMEINGELVKAELLDATKARQVYEDIVRKSLDPALFEYAHRGLFKVRIFPIEPHSKKEVRIRYTELLPKDGTVIRYTYPLDTAKYTLQPIPDFTLKIEVGTGAGRVLKTVYSPSHEVEVTRKGEGQAVIGLESDKMAVDEDFQLYLSQRSTDGTPVELDFLTHYENGPEKPGHFLLLISPPAWDPNRKPAPKDVLFVFDSSGSMKGAKMDQAREAMRYCVDHLNEEDRFEVIRFSTEAEAVFGDLVPADPQHREQARKFLDTVSAVGGTAIEEALTLAMKTAVAKAENGRPSQILFLTDGKPTLGATEDEAILKSLEKAAEGKKSPVRVFCFGIGSNLNTKLLDLVAERTRAVSDYVLAEESIEDKISRFFAKISDPVLTNLELEIDGTEWIRARYPKDLPDLFQGDQLVVLGTCQSARSEGTVKLSGLIQGERRDFFLPVSLREKTSNPFIAKLWATRRVGYLLDEIRLHGENDELRDEVASLARQYGIITPYTSYLILEDEERRNVPPPLRTQAVTIPEVPALAMEYESLKSRIDGEGAVGTAQAFRALKESKKPMDIRTANDAVDRARGGAFLPGGQSRVIDGKTFFQNGNLWTDQETQALPPSAPRRRIEFASPAYFELLTSRPSLSQWLSVGAAVQLAVDGELIEIVSPNPTKE